MFGANIVFPEKSGAKIWFYKKSTSGEEKVMIDGLGVTAEIVESLGATNGIIHVIDTVLGVPAQSISDKLKDDPMLSSTFSLGEQDRFNSLIQPGGQYTYLVPSDAAWDVMRYNLSGAHKILFMGNFGYHATNLLERHIKIGEALSDEELVTRTKKEGGVTMLRGSSPLTFTILDDGTGKRFFHFFYNSMTSQKIYLQTSTPW